MQIPVQITFRNIGPSPAIEAAVRERASKLERFFDRIISCRVVVEAPHRSKRKGKLYQIRISLTVPGEELAVTAAGPQDPAHEDVYVAIRDAFDAAERRLQDYADRLREPVKTPAASLPS